MMKISLFNLIFAILLVATLIEGLTEFKESECGVTKSCLRWSPCDFPSCDYAVSWKVVTRDNETKYLEIELVGTLTSPNNGYIALGFSLDDKMNHNAVVDCYTENGQMGIEAGYNENHKNYVLQDKETDLNLLVKFEGELYGVEHISEKNILRCRFLRLMSPSTNVEKLLDLAGVIKYYLLNAKGDYEGKPLFHFSNKRASSKSYNLELLERNDQVPTDFLMYKCHACLMIIGWVFFATNGIIMAYFYKNNWAEKTIFKGKIWFRFHQLVQSLCVICVAVGFIIIFVKVGGYSTLKGLPNSAHPIMGIVATSLMFINLIMAILRCHPESPSRWIFNTVHFTVGISAYILAICTIVIGIQLSGVGQNLSNLNYPWILVIVFLFLIILLFIYGELRKKVYLNNSINTIRRSYNLSISNNEDNQKHVAGKEIIILSAIISLAFGITFLTIILIN